MADISTINLAGVAALVAGNTNFTYDNGVLHYEGQYDEFYIEDVSWPDRHGVMWRVTFSYEGPYYTMEFGSTKYSITINASASGHVEWFYATDEQDAESNYYGGAPLELTGPAYLRVYRSGDFFTGEYSYDNATWVQFMDAGGEGPVSDTPAGDPWTVWAHDIGGVMDFTHMVGITVADPGDGDDEDTVITQPAAPRTTPNANAPVVAKTRTCATILDLVKEFSEASGWAVRIVGAATIELVDMRKAIPTAFRRNPAIFYTDTKETLTSGTNALLLSKGTMDLTTEATVTGDDVGIFTSGWRIPNALPYPGLAPGPVAKVSYSFGRNGFQADIAQTYPDIPLQVRRTQ